MLVGVGVGGDVGTIPTRSSLALCICLAMKDDLCVTGINCLLVQTSGDTWGGVFILLQSGPGGSIRICTLPVWHGQSGSRFMGDLYLYVCRPISVVICDPYTVEPILL